MCYFNLLIRPLITVHKSINVCPWNRFSKNNNEKEFTPNEEIISMTKYEWLEITDEVFKKITKNSAIKRTKYNGLKRNIKFIYDDK